MKRFSIYFTNRWKWKKTGMITFYLLPTIEFSKDETDSTPEEDSFSIYLEWLFWCLTFVFNWKKGGRNG